MSEPFDHCMVNAEAPETPMPLVDPLPKFPNGDPFGACAGLVSVLNFLDALGIEYERVDIDVPATLAYQFTDPRTGKPMRVVQYVDFDDGIGTLDEPLTWAVRTYPADEPTPCMVATITEEGSRSDLWPDEVSELAMAVPHYVYHRYCHTHHNLVEVEDQDVTDDDLDDQHAPGCQDMTCTGECMFA